MVKAIVNEFNFDSFRKVISLDDQSWSLFFCIGYSLFKILARSKLLLTIQRSFSTALKKLIQECILFNSSDESYLQTYKSYIEYIEQQESLQNIHSSLNELSNEAFINQVLMTGRTIFYYMFRNEDMEYIFRNNPNTIFSHLSEYLGCYIKIWWNGGNYLYGPSKKGPGGLAHIYYSESNFYWLIGKDDEDLEKCENPEMKKFQENFFCNCQDVFALNEGIKSETSSTYPKLYELIKVMANSIVNNNLYSSKVLEALKQAMLENDELSSMNEVNLILGIKPYYCENHKNYDFIKLFCKNQHCKYCVFENIKKNFTKTNYLISCTCGVQIPPKSIAEIKKDAAYKEFSKNYQKRI